MSTKVCGKPVLGIGGNYNAGRVGGIGFYLQSHTGRFLASESGQKKMAGAIFKAFRQYKEEYDYYSSGTEDSAVVVGSPESNENRREREGISAEEVEYRVQFCRAGSGWTKIPILPRFERRGLLL